MSEGSGLRGGSKFEGGGRRSSSGWWITIAEKDLDAWKAIILCKSLRMNLTNHEIAIIIGDKVSDKMSTLLGNVFDYVIELKVDDELVKNDDDNIKLLESCHSELLLFVSLWKQCNARKGVFIHPSSLVLKNCDELFEIQESFAAVSKKHSLGFHNHLIVFEPSRELYKGMVFYLINHWKELNNTTTTEQFLNEYHHCTGGGGLTGEGKTMRTLGDQYNILRSGDNLQDSRDFNIEYDAKIVHFTNGSPWTLSDQDIFVKLWKSICSVTLLEVESIADNNKLNGGGHKQLTEQFFQETNFEKCQKSIDQTLFTTSSYQLLLAENQLKDLEDTLAIVGLSLRLPGANDLVEFWNLLVEGRDETKPCPPERYFTRQTVVDEEEEDEDGKATTPVGYLKCPIEEFDAKFFEISPREAEYMDPQQRLLLEVSWEALENAGINPASLYGNVKAGVFVGLWSQEYAMHISAAVAKNGKKKENFTHKYLGNAICASSARISHFLGLKGPSVAIEAGCASALQGLHSACSALKSGEIDLAISAGVNIVLGGASEFSSLDSFILSPDGKCKTFDESANGFARAEGVVCLVLKRSWDAIRNGDKILGIIRGSAMNHDGGESNLGTPNALAQELVLKAALNNSKLSPNDVTFFEAHGTGTPIGDPIEFHALNQVFANHGRSSPLYVSSVKTNIGHTEAVSGLAGLVKVLLCLQHAILPKHLHLKCLNPLIGINEIPAIIPTENTELVPTNAKLGLVAGVSSFGLSGSNVHVIVQEPPITKAVYQRGGMERTHHLFVLSAKSETALQALVSKYISMLESSSDRIGSTLLSLADLAYSVNTSRVHFRHRLAIVSKDTEHLLNSLEKGYYHARNNVPIGEVEKPKVVSFLFTGQGSQYVGMAKTLYTSSPVFRWCLDRCARLLATTYNLNLYEILSYNMVEDKKNPNQSSRVQTNTDSSNHFLLNNNNNNNSILSQIGLFCVQVSLAELWTSFSVIPSFVLGHSVGEFAAAVVGGILTLEDGLRLVVERAKLVNTLANGRMLVVRSSTALVVELIKEFEGMHGGGDGDNEVWIDIAAINSESEVVVSGSCDSIKLFESYCQARPIVVGTSPLLASHAFHSRAMDRITKQYSDITSTIIPSQPAPRFRYISGTTAKELKTSADFDSHYWVCHLRQPVRFMEGFKSLLAEGCNTFIEIGPSPILLGLGMASIPPTSSINEFIWAPSIRKNEDNWDTILSSLAKLYIANFEIDWVRFDAGYKRVRIFSLPNYPFQRDNYWFRGGGGGGGGRVDGQGDSIIINSKMVHPILGKRIPTPSSGTFSYVNSISSESLSYVVDHKVGDKIILPAAAYLELVFAAGLDVLCGGTKGCIPLTLHNLNVEAPLELKDETSVQLQTIVTSDMHDVDELLVYDVQVYKQVSFEGSGSDGGKWKKLVSGSFIPCVASTTESFSPSSSPLKMFSVLHLEELKSHLTPKTNIEELYNMLGELGIKFGPRFRSIQAIWVSETECLVETSLPLESSSSSRRNPYIVHPILLDAMIQTCILPFTLRMDKEIESGELNEFYLPVSIKKCSITFQTFSSSKVGSKCYIHSVVVCPPPTEPGTAADSSLLRNKKPSSSEYPSIITLYNDSGEQLVVLEGIEFLPTNLDAFSRILAADSEQIPSIYEELWLPRLGFQTQRVDIKTYIKQDSKEEQHPLEMIKLLEDCERFSDVHDTLLRVYEGLCYLYMCRSLVETGWNYDVGQVVSIVEFCKNGLISDTHIRVISTWFRTLEVEGNIQICADNPDQSIVTKPLPNIEEIEEMISRLKNSVPDIYEYNELEYRFVANCGEHLTSILQGKLSPYSVLFPEDKSTVGAPVFYASERNKLLHKLGAVCLSLLLARIKEREEEERGKPGVDFVVRILEIGAGTGSATTPVLDELNKLCVPYEYTWTDISPLFLKMASKKFVEFQSNTNNNSKLLYKVLDIEVDPKTQGFPPHYYDIVIADNVLHATKSLSESLASIHSLLLPSGCFVLTEQVELIRFSDISFGFLDSWWRFNDYELRPRTPIVNVESWKGLLTSHGFNNLKEYKIYPGFPYSVFISFRNDDDKLGVEGLSTSNPVQPRQILGKPNVWLIFGLVHDGFTMELQRMLRLVGKDVIVVYNSTHVAKSQQQVGGVEESNNVLVVNPTSAQGIQDLIIKINDGGEHNNIEGILYVWGALDYPQLMSLANDDLQILIDELSGGLLHLLQAVATTIQLLTKIYVVTKGGQLDVVVEQQNHSVVYNPISSILWGIVLTFNNEYCNHYSVCIDIDPAADQLLVNVKNVFCQIWLNESEHQVAFRSGVKYVKRVVNIDKEQAIETRSPLTLPNTDRYKVVKPPSGCLNDIKILAAGQSELEEGQVEIKVVCCGLNFKDLLLTLESEGDSGRTNLEAANLSSKLSKSNGNELELGMDFSGIINRIGGGVKTTTNNSSNEFKVGDRVFGSIVGGALASHVVVSPKTLMHIPNDTSFEEASTLGCVYLTAIYYLKVVAKLNSNDKVLIHAGSGGVGLAAIQIAQNIGCQIFTTAGSNRKRSYLRSLGIEHIYNSRTLAYGLEILADTAGAGVNVVLNALTGPGFKETSLSVCAANGRFLEMSKLNVWTKEEIGRMRPDVFYYIQGLDQVLNINDQQVVETTSSSSSSSSSISSFTYDFSEMKNSLMNGLYSGCYKPLPYTRFPLSWTRSAFRFLKEAKQIGKVVIKLPTTECLNGVIHHKVELFNCYSTYCITGGLGGIGLEVAKWMACSGASYIVLVGRNPPSTQAEVILSSLKTKHSQLQLLVIQADVSDYSACEGILNQIQQHPTIKFPPLKGIMHAAGIIVDGVLINQSLETLNAVYKAKIWGCWNLHCLTQQLRLEHFVLFSSVVSTFGGMGQVNHCSANKYLDSFAKWRHEAGYPCLSINWGPWSDVGMAVNVKNVEASIGIKMMSPSACIATLERIFCSQSHVNTIVFDFAGNKVLRQVYNTGSLIELIKFNDESKLNSAIFEQKIELIKSAPPSSEEQLVRIKEFLEFIVRDTLRLPEHEPIDPNQDLHEIGIDSLMAMELRSKIQQLLAGYDSSRGITVNELQENRTINKIGKLLKRVIDLGGQVGGGYGEEEECKVLSEDEMLELIKQDSILPTEIKTQAQLGSSSKVSSFNKKDFKDLLLTGVTGHLGPYILRQLLQFKPSLRVVCIIRASSDEEAKERLELHLERLDLLDDELLASALANSNNIVCLAGNLIETNFGLNQSLYYHLTESVDGIIHCASYIGPLSSNYGNFSPTDLRSTNVFGLINILKFATKNKIKPLQFPSNVYACSGLDSYGRLPEEWPSDQDIACSQVLKPGVQISKFVCEKLLKEATESLGIPIQVVRHHLLGGDSTKGCLPIERSQLIIFMLTCQKLGMFPQIDFNITGVAVDVAAFVSISLFMNPTEDEQSWSGVYNLNNPKVGRFMEMYSLLKEERGIAALQIVPFCTWRETALNSTEGVSQSVMMELLNELFTSTQFHSHVIMKEVLEGPPALFRNSDKLKNVVENVDELMIAPLELAKLHFNYYEKLFGKDNVNAYFEALAKK